MIVGDAPEDGARSCQRAGTDPKEKGLQRAACSVQRAAFPHRQIAPIRIAKHRGAGLTVVRMSDSASAFLSSAVRTYNTMCWGRGLSALRLTLHSLLFLFEFTATMGMAP